MVISNDSGQHDLHVSYVCLHERNSIAIASGTLEITTYLQIDKRNAEEERLEVLGVVPQADENSLESQSVGPEACKLSISRSSPGVQTRNTFKGQLLVSGQRFDDQKSQGQQNWAVGPLGRSYMLSGKEFAVQRQDCIMGRIIGVLQLAMRQFMSLGATCSQ